MSGPPQRQLREGRKWHLGAIGYGGESERDLLAAETSPVGPTVGSSADVSVPVEPPVTHLDGGEFMSVGMDGEDFSWDDGVSPNQFFQF